VHFLLLLFENRPGDVADAVHLRPVDLRLYFGLMPSRRIRRASTPFRNVSAHTLGFIRLNRARMGFLLANSNGYESVQNLLALDFQLPR
jgi:hypothetical protein